MKALDVYFALCLMFVAFSLLEYAFVNQYVGKSAKAEKVAGRRRKARRKDSSSRFEKFWAKTIVCI